MHSEFDAAEAVRVIGRYARRLRRGGASNETVGALLGLMSFFVEGGHETAGAQPEPVDYNGETYEAIDT